MLACIYARIVTVFLRDKSGWFCYWLSNVACDLSNLSEDTKYLVLEVFPLFRKQICTSSKTIKTVKMLNTLK